jgi:thymidylate synthase
MRNYQELLNLVWTYGERSQTRNGETASLFGAALRFDLRLGFPAVTIKQLYFRSVANELAGFLRAETDASKMGSGIWLKNAEDWSGSTDMGKVYGYMWRRWNDSLDQLAACRDSLRDNPSSRRHVVTAWDPSRLDEGCLPPCHYAFQFYVNQTTNRLSCMAHMRSVDCVLGMPFDIASYALLTHIMANELGYAPGDLLMTFGDTHIYTGHQDAVAAMLNRNPMEAPKLVLDPKATIDNFTGDMAALEKYRHHQPVEAELYV